MVGQIQVLHYLNQFFGGVGGEEEAGIGPQWFDGPRGPGQLLQTVASDITVIGTIVVGDNYMAENLEDGPDEVIALIRQKLADDPSLRPDLLLAGPAFSAGRYGMACGAVCRAVQEQFSIPALTALHPDNPAVDIYRQSVVILRAAYDVMGMQEAIAGMARVGLKLFSGEEISPSEDETIPRGLRQNYFAEATGAERAIEMLLRKLNDEPFETEYPMPKFSRVPPASAVKDLSSVTLGLVTSGGIVPRGNPDRIESANASKYGEYSLTGLDHLTAESHQSVHGGYDPTYANEDPNRVLPLDALRELEDEGRIGHLHDTYYATVGNATSVKRAEEYGREIAAKLVNVGVQAVILTST